MKTDRERAAELIKALGFHTVLHKLLDAYEPKTDQDTREVVDGLIKGLSATVAYQAYGHIQDHEGYDCAKELIEGVARIFEEEATSSLNNVLEREGRSSLRHGLTPVEPSVNEQTRNTILKEIDNEG